MSDITSEKCDKITGLLIGLSGELTEDNFCVEVTELLDLLSGNFIDEEDVGEIKRSWG